MSKFLITTGSHFTPFTYDELVKPIQETVEQHRLAQEAYDTLDMQSSALARYLSEADDKDVLAKEMLNGYSEKLKSLQDDLYNNGYSAKTVRGLSSARSGYAKDITRLQSAIESRGKLSDAYWQTKHNDPTAIMGTDPGDLDLDNYIKDSNYGKDYYNYSGAQFKKEVADNMQIMAKELLRQPQVLKDPKLVGYLQTIISKGATEEQVRNAMNIVKSAVTVSKQMGANGIIYDSPEAFSSADDMVEDLIASSIIDSLNSTGAYDKVSDSEFDRLVDYAAQGARWAIGETETKSISDKAWDKWAAEDTYRNNYNYSHPAQQQPSVSGGGDLLRAKSSDATKVEKDINKNLKKGYTDKAGNAEVKYIWKDGVPYEVTDKGEAFDLIYNTQERQGILDIFGLDIAQRGYGRGPWPTTDSKQVNADHTYRTNKPDKKEARDLHLDRDKDVVVQHWENGKWITNPDATKSYNEVVHKHNTKVNSIIRENERIDKTFNVNDYALKPKQVKKLGKEYNLNGVDASDYDLALAQSTEDRLEMAPEIVSTDSKDDDKRENIASSISSFFQDQLSFGNMGKASQYAFYKVGNDGKLEKNAVRDLKDVGLLDKNGYLDKESINKVYFLPEDLNNASPKIRMQTSKGTFVIDAAMAGNKVHGLLTDPNVQEVMKLVSYPKNNFSEVINLSTEEADDITENIYNAMSTRDGLISFYPQYTSGNEQHPFNIQDVVKNSDLYNMYVNGLNDYIQYVLNSTL